MTLLPVRFGLGKFFTSVWLMTLLPVVCCEIETGLWLTLGDDTTPSQNWMLEPGQGANLAPLQ